MSSRIILGTVQFGLPYGINNAEGKPAKEKVYRILDKAYEYGIRQLDSADAYGDAQFLIGKYVKESERSFHVNSKFHVSQKQTIPDQLSETLAQLQQHAVYVYFYHRFTDFTQYPESIQALELLREQGRIGKIGVSVYTNEEFEIAVEHDAIDVIQFPFNLLDNFSRRGFLIQRAKEKGKTLQVRSVFLQGLFFKEEDHWPVTLHPLMPYVRKLKNLSKEYGVSLYDMAIAYVSTRNEIDYILIGVDLESQLEVNMKALNCQLDSSLIGEIEAIIVKEEGLLYPYNWK
ncbi:MAG TPA: aldo/keto reductase [Flavisolibacter sp.]|jgi:aryl-alcohol dehydrogenase-like predicted oxidoreductase|nr:aldo/keto reductase [Flavisolibacter sp.]